MVTSQGPARGRVVKLSVRPQHGVVTALASQREALDVVHWRGCVVVVLLVATHATGVGAGQVVIIVDVTLRALRAGQVVPGQWPARGRVIKLPVGP